MHVPALWVYREGVYRVCIQGVDVYTAVYCRSGPVLTQRGASLIPRASLLPRVSLLPRALFILSFTQREPPGSLYAQRQVPKALWQSGNTVLHVLHVLCLCFLEYSRTGLLNYSEK